MKLNKHIHLLRIDKLKPYNLLILLRQYVSASQRSKFKVLLPKTNFPQKLRNYEIQLTRNAQINMVDQVDEFYYLQRQVERELDEFILHDGPPYANGELHMGHAMNKILKDAILRHKVLCGQKIHYVPGWDCHGLPIELKAIRNDDIGKTALETRQIARQFALNTVDLQQKTYKSWGVLGAWKDRFLTCSESYVKRELNLFYRLFSRNIIFRDLKPVYWSPSSRTALAESELEYNDSHVSRSVYYRFRIKTNPFSLENLFALVWTTTPWTLPANQAICFSPHMKYTIARHRNTNNHYIIASSMAEKLSTVLNMEWSVLSDISNEALMECSYIHPLFTDRFLSFLQSEHVTEVVGTGLVHAAPAHGQEDFLVFLKNNIPLINVINDLGQFTSDCGPLLEGLNVLDEGCNTIINLLKNDIVLLENYQHSYPYDWRTKQPVIVRASEQWFFNTSTLKERVSKLVQEIEIHPDTKSDVYKQLFLKQIDKRPYWCISRQRNWGVPIPVFFNKTTGDYFINKEIIEHQCNLIDKYGCDYWWSLPLGQLLPVHLREHNSEFSDLDKVVKGKDIFDIWFDSGISWAACLGKDTKAHIYLEGMDQINGWFYSSAMTSVALQDKLPFKELYVHGFALDKHGNKMSKSLGNVVNPDDIIREHGGIDVLRWWVLFHSSRNASTNITQGTLNDSTDNVEKIRNTLRFILGNVPEAYIPPYNITIEHLLDRYMLDESRLFVKLNLELLEQYNFSKVCKNVLHFVTNQVSAMYFTCAKDRLYCNESNSAERRSAVFVLHEILFALCRILAPIVPHLVEEVYFHYNGCKTKKNQWYFTDSNWHIDHTKTQNVDLKLQSLFTVIGSIRRDLIAITQKLSNCSITVHASAHLMALIEEITSIDKFTLDLADILQVSTATVILDTAVNEEILYSLKVSETHLRYCSRCRRYQAEKEDQLCTRCSQIKADIA